MPNTHPTSATQDETAAVAAAVEKLRVLMLDPDKDKLGALVAADLSYGHSGGHVDTRESFIGDLVSKASNFLSIELADQTIKVVGDTAIIRHTLIGQSHDKGQAPDKFSLLILQIWQKHEGRWKMLARQAARAAH